MLQIPPPFPKFSRFLSVKMTVIKALHFSRDRQSSSQSAKDGADLFLAAATSIIFPVTRIPGASAGSKGGFDCSYFRLGKKKKKKKRGELRDCKTLQEAPLSAGKRQHGVNQQSFLPSPHFVDNLSVVHTLGCELNL